MNTMTIRIALIATGSAFALSGCDSRNDSTGTGTSQTDSVRGTSTTPADNTGSNRDDSQRDARTPMDQSESSEHIRLTADIRRAVVADDTLSTNAKNCKIITDESGRVWLRGVVESQSEKDQVERIATQIAGTGIVTNELEVDTR